MMIHKGRGSFRWMRGLMIGVIISEFISCTSEQATQMQCEMIMSRLIQLELQEMGYNDPTLTARWDATLKRRYRPEINKCIGRSIHPNAMQCISLAKTAEIVSHECLR